MYIKKDVLDHLKFLNKAVAKVNGEAFMNAATLLVELRVGNKVFVLHPMFITKLDGKKVYSHQFSPETINFAGWKPYINRVTPEVGKKLVFKAFVERHGLHTPAYATDQNTHLENVIVKKDISSFGENILGPFANTDAYQLEQDSGQFFETFTPGKIVKIWYWNTQPVIMESQPMPAVTGDGKSTIRELVDAYLIELKSRRKINWNYVEELLAFQDSGLDEILRENVSRMVDFRYISAFSVPESMTSISLRDAGAVFSDLYRLGQAMNLELKQVGMVDTLYSVDAIQDGDGKFWFLEVNFNPAVHPCLYMDMVKSLTAGNVYRELRRPGVVQSAP